MSVQDGTLQKIDVSLGLENSHAIITGGGGLIGKAVVNAFLSAGANVTSVDITYTETFEQELVNVPPSLSLLCVPADVTNPDSIKNAFRLATKTFGTPTILITLAALDLSVLPHTGLIDMEPSQWLRTLEINVGGTMLCAQEWLRHLRSARPHEETTEIRNPALILIGSESGSFGERTNPDYAASKSAVQGGLLKSLAAEAPRIHPRARVNALAPGPVDTNRFRDECAADPSQLYVDAEATVAQRRPVPVEAVARAALMLASERFSGSVHGQVLSVDGGKSGKLLWGTGEV